MNSPAKEFSGRGGGGGRGEGDGALSLSRDHADREAMRIPGRGQCRSSSSLATFVLLFYEGGSKAKSFFGAREGGLRRAQTTSALGPARFQVFAIFLKNGLARKEKFDRNLGGKPRGQRKMVAFGIAFANRNGHSLELSFIILGRSNTAF